VSEERSAGWAAECATRWARAEFGPETSVEEVTRFPGHSGFTYGLTVVHDGLRELVVLRIPPAGVRRSNNTDVLRLVPLLGRMHEAGIPVPRVRWFGEDEQFFGVPYLMVDRLAGKTFPDIFLPADPAEVPSPETARRAFEAAFDALVAIHGVELDDLRGGSWYEPRTPVGEIDLWLPLLRKGEDADVVRQGEEIRDRLVATLPSGSEQTVLQGDFYSNNWLFEGTRLTGVLDWENTTIANPLGDLGWYAALFDPECWGPSRAQSLAWAPPVDDMLEYYARKSGRDLADINWHRAVMVYRVACITPHNLRLHRSGRRPDPAWEVFGEALPHLLQRARELLA
jgi:aminoglycoside phosphotransferase (APT) family kinase protein